VIYNDAAPLALESGATRVENLEAFWAARGGGGEARKQA